MAATAPAAPVAADPSAAAHPTAAQAGPVGAGLGPFAPSLGAPGTAEDRSMTTLRAERLDRGSALHLLAAARTGRVVYTAAAMPAVWPSPFRVAPDGGVLLRTSADSGLVEAIGGTLVAFEADELHLPDGAGWCVTLLGRAVVGAEDPTNGDVEIHILPEAVNGRRLPLARRG